MDSDHARTFPDGLEYLDGQLESFAQPNGRIVSTNGNALNAFRYEYNLTDHLGNVRLVFADLNGNGRIDQTTSKSTNEILQETHYYPFGMTHYGSYSTNTGVGEENRYRYNGKELNKELRLYDYGARWYDPAIARWASIDPLADTFPNWSPYNYTFNDPVKHTDPDGRNPIIGAGVGFVIGAGLSAVNQYYNNREIDLGQVTIDGFKGGIVGGLIGAGQPAALQVLTSAGLEGSAAATFMTTAAVAGTASGVAETIAQTAEVETGRRESMDGGEIATSMVIGGVTGPAGAQTGSTVRSALTSGSQPVTGQTAGAVIGTSTAVSIKKTLGNMIESISNWMFGEDD